MTNQTDSQWRATAAFNYEFENLVDCVAAAIKHFLHRRSHVFIILWGGTRARWYLMPWSQYRHIPGDCPAASASAVFRGTFDQLRSIAQSFPLDMFAQEPSDEDTDADTETLSAPGGAAQGKTPLDETVDRIKEKIDSEPEKSPPREGEDGHDPLKTETEH